jgi:hypothetical protein
MSRFSPFRCILPVHRKIYNFCGCFFEWGYAPQMGVLNRDSAEPMDLGVFMAPIFTQTSFYLVRTQNWCVIPCDNALSSIS